MGKKRIKFLKFEGALIYNIVVAVLSVITLIWVSVGGYSFDDVQIYTVLHLLHIMFVVVSIISCVMLVVFRSRIDHLLDTLQAVADGNIVIAVEQKNKGSYETAYKNLSKLAKQIKGGKKEMQEFTNDFMHEFKTPITAIHGFAEYLLTTGEDIETPERMQYLKVISDESIRLADLAQKNLLLAKVEACEIITDKEKYDLSEQLKRCTILLLPQIEAKKIDIMLDVEGLSYYGDAELMEQVWINLISNAIKFTPENGEITITGCVENDTIILKFTDSGTGMDEETKKHLFDRYYQNKIGRQIGGNGIGLSIVHRIISLCNGQIHVSSKENEGSTFIIVLPQAS